LARGGCGGSTGRLCSQSARALCQAWTTSSMQTIRINKRSPQIEEHLAEHGELRAEQLLELGVDPRADAAPLDQSADQHVGPFPHLLLVLDPDAPERGPPDRRVRGVAGGRVVCAERRQEVAQVGLELERRGLFPLFFVRLQVRRLQLRQQRGRWVHRWQLQPEVVEYEHPPVQVELLQP
jgi:hypothetical protein